MNIQEKIVKLTNEWYHLIGKDHHKDRDCHFYIETKWSYGQEPVYSIQHHGYIVHDFEGEDYETYDQALEGLVKFLEKIIAEEKQYNIVEDSIF